MALNEKGSSPAGSMKGLDDSGSTRHGDDIELGFEPLQEQSSETIRHQSPNPLKDDNNHIVSWDGPDDPENPMNWPVWKKWIYTVALGSVTFTITFASSVFSTATVVTSMEFGVSEEVMVLATSLFVLGFAFGPLIWGPMSEYYGRKIPLFSCFFIFSIFQIAVATAENLQTIMICRFFGGFFGSAPLGIVGGTFADFWAPVDRGIAMCVFASATFIGPVAGPIVGSFITESYLGWRWTEYITAIMGFFFGTVAFLTVPETYAPVLLSRRAAKLRYETGNWALHAKSDESPMNFNTIASVYLTRPIMMLVMEPILILMTIYMAFVYGFIYLLFEAYPISFQTQRTWSPGLASLPFLAITVGVVIGACGVVYHSKSRVARQVKEKGRVIPEERLIPMMVGAVLLPGGMFWFAWTSDPSISWVPSVLSGIMTGSGIILIFLQGLNYIIDNYLMNANSAIAANGLLRSGFGAGFPLFASPMFLNLGVNWATSLLGFLGVAMIPVPFLFYIFGARIRAMSRYTPKLPHGGPPNPFAGANGPLPHSSPR
ncbi:bicyclomycin resistance protein, putative [Talaromyces stipitatus ATCC 10500]|uniref:Bicyclomycin resistance protein, putative n=1 Tax=Talaromyces stipitatus (strain ATCC 10500 / CBS 375.48 / QM 6759 / NRRL 1006) TaxID=441959 RepID=B8LXC6_TALSN|nr:bicyclomycin resistance protein, putative [Talaromyces stipitatus ATCC 10500]EED23207.1 bicyclomycin resistance protein, putative [Talaromyces stipitatus ATCC 10500]